MCRDFKLSLVYCFTREAENNVRYHELVFYNRRGSQRLGARGYWSQKFLHNFVKHCSISHCSLIPVPFVYKNFLPGVLNYYLTRE